MISPELPDELEWLAVLIELEGTLVGSTGLFPRSESERTLALAESVHPGGDTLFMLGFASSQFSATVLPSEAVLRSSPLTPALDDRASLLPRPRWAGRAALENGRAHVVSARLDLDLTADWIPTSTCGASDRSVTARFDCLRCAGVGQQNGCALTLDTQAGTCGSAGSIETKLDITGRPRLPIQSGPCEFVEQQGEASIFDCAGVVRGRQCRVEISARSEGAWFSIERAPFFLPQGTPEPFGHDDGVTRVGTGYALAMAVLEDRVVIGLLGDGRFDSFRCTNESPSTLHVMDRETLTPLHTAVAPPCLTAMAKDPTGPGFLAYASTTEGAYIARFSNDGELQSQSSSVALDKRHWAHQILALPEHDAVAVALAGREDTREKTGHVVLHDIDTLDVRAISPPLGAHVFSIARRDAFSLVVLTGTADTVHVLSLPGLAVLESVRLRGPCEAPKLLPNRMILDSLGRVLFTAAEPPLVARLDLAEQNCVADYVGEASAFAVPLMPWPDNTERVLLGATEGPPRRRAMVLGFVPLTGQLMPGHQTIGQGSVAQLEGDERGRVYALLGDEGVLVRLSPR